MSDATVDRSVLRIAIAEDTQSDADTLKAMLGGNDSILSVDHFKSGEALLSSFDKGLYDLVFMDVFMGDLNGIETTERIRAIDSQVVVVFTTTSEDFTREGYRLNAYKYLLKPLVATDVSEALDLAAMKRDKRQGATLAIASENVPIIIPLADIIYIESRNRRSLINTVDACHSTTMTIDSLEQLLPAPRFLRSHRSYVVNLDHVDELGDDFVMDNGAIAYITVKNHRKIKHAYEDYLFNSVRSDSD
ncbi:MAG: LytTR family DNA-binding domain-containing protein [Actinomycetia bacterium]|nr:LytTR family DNA-binding domain-containing protein [Actinomycetes bacterium]